jgi:hypothetical protein
MQTTQSRYNIIHGYERIEARLPESDDDRERRRLDSILNFALRELKDGRDPRVVAHALRNSLVTA